MQIFAQAIMDYNFILDVLSLLSVACLIFFASRPGTGVEHKEVDDIESATDVRCGPRIEREATHEADPPVGSLSRTGEDFVSYSPPRQLSEEHKTALHDGLRDSRAEKRAALERKRQIMNDARLHKGTKRREQKATEEPEPAKQPRRSNRIGELNVIDICSPREKNTGVAAQENINYVMKSKFAEYLNVFYFVCYLLKCLSSLLVNFSIATLVRNNRIHRPRRLIVTMVILIRPFASHLTLFVNFKFVNEILQPFFRGPGKFNAKNR